MKFNIFTSLGQIQDLDTYTQNRVLGSWQFMANSTCINQALREVPARSDESGIDGYNEYDSKRRAVLDKLNVTEGDFQSELPCFIALSRFIEQSRKELNFEKDTDYNSLYDTLRYLNERGAPTRAQFEGEWAARIAMGMPKPQGISRQQFVDYEFERAMQRYENLLARGEEAVDLCQGIQTPENRTFDDLPQWATESLQRKMIEKLVVSWEKLSLALFNPRLSKERRDEARGNQMLIEQLLTELGEPIPGSQDSDDDVADEAA